MRPPRRSDSQDTFPPVTAPEREAILLSLQQLEGKVLGRLADVDQRLDEHEEAIFELRQNALEQRESKHQLTELISATRRLGDDVRAVLRRDAEQSDRIAALELQAVSEGKRAGKTSGRAWGSLAALVGVAVAAAAQWLVSN